MPELYSRMDDANWLTPSIADILEQGAPPPGGDGSIRDHMLTIQRELADMETPAKIVNVRSTPSYTLYIAKPETVGRLGSRRTITPQEIRRSLARVAEAHTDWLIGFMPKIQEDETAIGILLRTNAHRPLSLRRLLVRNTFRNVKSTTAFVAGITLEQELIVHDLAQVGHILVVGSDNAKVHFLRSFLITLISLNTPHELRIILAGKGNEPFKSLVATPHTIGKLIVDAPHFERVLEGLLTELQRRQDAFNELSVNTLDQYNTVAKEQNKGYLPRILLLIDSLADPDWQASLESLQQMTQQLLKVGATHGLHCVIVTNDVDSLPSLRQKVKLHIIMRTSAKMLTDQVPDFHPSLLRFVDAFMVDQQTTQKIVPLEVCSTSNAELISTITYWQELRQKRQEDGTTGERTSGRTGVTDLLAPATSTPVPTRNPVLTRATAILLDRDTQPMEAASPEITTSENEKTPLKSEDTLKQATALAAYLGWLSVGALMDVLFLPQSVAEETLATLKSRGVLEQTDSKTPRFVIISSS
jgi:hypothetical protein